MTNTERARECAMHLQTAIAAMELATDKLRLAREVYPDDYADPLYNRVLNNQQTVIGHTRMLRIPALAWIGEGSMV